MTRLKELLSNLTRLQIEQESLRPLRQFTFTLFPALPVELRNKIWKMASFEPRHVQLLAYSSVDAPRLDVRGQFRVPSILHTSKEARSEGLRYYAVCYEKPTMDVAFARLFDADTFAAESKGNSMFINFEVDKFSHKRLPGNTAVPTLETYNFEKVDLLKIKRLEVRCKDLDYSLKAIFAFKNNNAMERCTHIFPGWRQGGETETLQGHLDWRGRQKTFRRNFQRNGGTIGKPLPHIKHMRVQFKWASRCEIDLSPCSPVSKIKELKV